MKNAKEITILWIGLLLFVGCTNKVVKTTPPQKTVPTPETKQLSMVAVGDALIHGAVYVDANTYQVGSDGYYQYDFTKMFTHIKDLIAPFDLKFYNQETVIGGKKLGLSHYPRFNSPDEIGLDLIKTGFNVVNLASNHTLDKGEPGAAYSAQFWENQDGIYAVGSYTSQEKRDLVRVEEKNGIKYSILSYTYGANGLPVPTGKEYLINLYSEEQVKKDIENVRDQVDLLIVSMHWGTEYVNEPNELQRQQANFLASLGVDVIIGHHPHVIQPIEFINNTLVIYSLGNFISAQDSINKRIGMMASFTFQKTTLDGKTIDRKVTNVQADLLWTHYSSDYANFEVLPFHLVTEKHLKNATTVYEQYKKIVNPINNEKIKVGFFEADPIQKVEEQ